MCCHRIPYSRTIFQHSTQNISRKSCRVHPDLYEQSPGQEQSRGGCFSWALPMLLWTLQPLVMQHFQGQAQGKAQLLCLPSPSSLFFSLSTSRTSTQFVPQHFCEIAIPRHSLVSKQVMGQAKISERPGSDKLLQVLNWASLFCKTDQKPPGSLVFL